MCRFSGISVCPCYCTTREFDLPRKVIPVPALKFGLVNGYAQRSELYHVSDVYNWKILYFFLEEHALEARFIFM